MKSSKIQIKKYRIFREFKLQRVISFENNGISKNSDSKGYIS